MTDTHCFWLLQSFCPLPWYSPSPKGKERDIDAQFAIQLSTVFYSLHVDQSRVSELIITLLQKDAPSDGG